MSTPIAFFISCSTGCSCCREENHTTGPYRSLHYTRETVERYKKEKRLASQYSKTGNYEIAWQEAEILPDGRVIVEDRVFGGFIDDPDSDYIGDDIDDSFCPGYSIDGSYSKSLPEGYVDPEPAKE